MDTLTMNLKQGPLTKNLLKKASGVFMVIVMAGAVACGGKHPDAEQCTELVLQAKRIALLIAEQVDPLDEEARAQRKLYAEIAGTLAIMGCAYIPDQIVAEDSPPQ